MGRTIGQPPPPVTDPPEPGAEPPPAPHLTTPTGRATVPVAGHTATPGQPATPGRAAPPVPPSGPAAIGQFAPPATGHAAVPGLAVPPGQIAVPGQAAVPGQVASPGQAAALPTAPPVTGHAAVPATPPAAGAARSAAGTAAAATAAPAIPAPLAAALPPPPAGPFPAAEAAFPGAPPAPTPTWRIRRHRGLDRLSVGRHAAPIAQLDELQLTIASFGLLLGHDQAGSPVTVRMFRPAPLHAVLLGSTWAARLVTHRALHFGARLVVVSRNPGGWIDLGRRATGRTDRVAVVEDIRSPASRVASADTPVLRVAGLSAAAEQDVPVDVLPQWNTRLSVQPQVTPDQLSQHRARQLAAADVVLIQRLTQPEAAAVGSVLKLSQRVSSALQVLRDDMLAVVTRTGVQYAWLRLTEAERTALGSHDRR